MQFDKKSNTPSSSTTDEMEETEYSDQEFQEEGSGIDDSASNSDKTDGAEQETAVTSYTPPRKIFGVRPTVSSTPPQTAKPTSSPPQTPNPTGEKTDDRVQLTMKLDKFVHARLKLHCIRKCVKQADLIAYWIDQYCAPLD